MADRDRIHQSPMYRRRGGPTQDHRDRTRAERHEHSVSPKRNARRNMTSDKEPWNIPDPNEDYGAGSRNRHPARVRGRHAPETGEVEQNRYAPQIGRTGKGPADLSRRSYWNDEEYEEPPFRNNYDDYDRTYRPSHRWE
jgi:hypothetical protein